jgi:DNA-binding transcriptional LysR family regulator
MHHRGMQFEALKVFCDVARYRSFSQAALANQRTQSAVSQIVLHLEERLGVQLVDRSTRPLQLTPRGKMYYDGCKGLVDQYLELEAAVRNAQDELEATVRVAAIYSVGVRDMHLYLERFEAQQPRARVHIEYLHPDRVYAEVLEGIADFGLVSFPRKSRDLKALPWREEEFVLTCAPSHPLARRGAVKPRDLEGVKYVGFDRDLVIRRKVDRFLREQKVAVDVVLDFDNIETIKKAVESEAGVALLPEPTVRREVEAGTLVALPLAGCRLVRPLGIIQRRQRKPSLAARRLVDLLRQPDDGPMGTQRNGHANGAGRSPHPHGTQPRRRPARAARKKA